MPGPQSGGCGSKSLVGLNSCPRRWCPGCRQWFRISSLLQPDSLSTAARTARRESIAIRSLQHESRRCFGLLFAKATHGKQNGGPLDPPRTSRHDMHGYLPGPANILQTNSHTIPERCRACRINPMRSLENWPLVSSFLDTRQSSLSHMRQCRCSWPHLLRSSRRSKRVLSLPLDMHIPIPLR
jgi:hypothetical protein